MEEDIILRDIQLSDCKKISSAFHEQGWNKPSKQYEQYLRFQKCGERDIIIAEYKDEFTGYLTIKWKSDYGPFREKSIPEIVDFNVLKKFQRKGIGTILMDEAEARIKKVSEYAGIGVGIYKDYGAAHVLYINRGYLPDGNGIIKDSMELKYGDQITIDDSIVFYMIKNLSDFTLDNDIP